MHATWIGLHIGGTNQCRRLLLLKQYSYVLLLRHTFISLLNLANIKFSSAPSARGIPVGTATAVQEIEDEQILYWYTSYMPHHIIRCHTRTSGRLLV